MTQANLNRLYMLLSYAGIYFHRRVESSVVCCKAKTQTSTRRRVHASSEQSAIESLSLTLRRICECGPAKALGAFIHLARRAYAPGAELLQLKICMLWLKVSVHRDPDRTQLRRFRFHSLAVALHFLSRLEPTLLPKLRGGGGWLISVMKTPKRSYVKLHFLQYN
jgi:hypothetical protein